VGQARGARPSSGTPDLGQNEACRHRFQAARAAPHSGSRRCAS
jgi:hypothetical protein